MWDFTFARRSNTFQIEQLESRTLFAADVVLEWNEIAQRTLRADRTYGGPTWASRNMAIVQAAVYDAVELIEGVAQPLFTHHIRATNASVEAAAATAAHHALVKLFPLQQDALDADLKATLSDISDEGAKRRGMMVGSIVALDILHARKNDGSDVVVAYVPDGQPGHWEPDPLNPTQSALGPNWGGVEPFVMHDGAQFRPPHPPALNSPAYTAAFEQVKAFGKIDSAVRTADQTEIGLFWAYDRASTGSPVVLYNQIAAHIGAQENNTLEENARLLGLVNVAMADAGIAAWDCKYVDNLWRPITAIRRAAEDGNPDTAADPTWIPLGAPGNGEIPDFTPPFPAYVSGHSTFGGATFEVLKQFYGSDNLNYSLTSDELPGVTRNFTTFSQAADENGISRIYLGIHWIFDNEFGKALGRQIGGYVVSHMMQSSEAEPLTVLTTAPAPLELRPDDILANRA